MSDQVQLRGGTTAQHAAFAGASREATVDTTKKTLVVHDGATLGGIPLLRQDMANVSAVAGRAALGSEAVGDAVFTAATSVAARTALAAAASGANGDITDLTALTIPRLGNRYLHARDEKATGSSGGTSSAGDNTRILNTMVANTITGASLASNQITLPAGSYRIFASAPCFAGDAHVLKLYNITDGADLLIGQVANASSSGAGFTTSAHVVGHFTLAATKVLSLKHKIAFGIANGLGLNAGAAIEVYAELIITKE